MDNNINTPASDESMAVQDGLYWYALTEDVSIYIKPKNGKGISVGVVETDNHYEYQIKRLYK